MSSTDHHSAPGSRLRGAIHPTAVFLVSANTLVLEIAAGRMLAPYVGMSLYTWTAIIATVLAGLSAGHWLGGRLADASIRTCHRRLSAALTLAAATTLACLPLVRLLSPVLVGGIADSVLAITLLSLALFFLPSLFAGIVSPILTRLALERAGGRHGRVLGRMFAAGAAGSIFGTLASGFLFIAWIGTIGTVLAVAALFLALALAALPASWQRAAPRLAGAGAVLLSAALPALWGWSTGGLAGACNEESRYFCIRVVDIDGEDDAPARLMVLDHLGHGINDRDRPTVLHSPYMELADRLAARRLAGRKNFSALFIGGGAYTLPRAWAARYPAARMDVFEIDPAVTRMARLYLWAPEGGRLSVEHRDARFALQARPAAPTWDVAFGDAFKDISVPVHLVTKEFAREVAARLTGGGIYIVNVVDNGLEPVFLWSMVRTLGGVFPSVEVWVDLDQMRSGGRATYVVLAARTPSPSGRLAGGPPFHRQWFRWPPGDLERRIDRPDVVTLTDDYAPVDRLLAGLIRRSD